MQVSSVSYYNNNQISHKNRLKSLNAINPIYIYADKYFNRMARMSAMTKPIMPDLVGKIDFVKSKNVLAWNINPQNSSNYILFLHGMSQNISDYQNLYKNVVEQNSGVFAVEYRGYGENKKVGVSEDKLRKDAEYAFQYLVKEKNIKPENIILMGHSMGGVLASHLASKHKDIKSLILVSPIVSMPNIGSKFELNKILGLGIPEKIKNFTEHCKPLKWLYNLQFNSLRVMTKIKTPTYIIQSRNDSVATVSGARELANLAKEKGVLRELKVFPSGGHKVDSNKINYIADIIGNIFS